MGNIKKNLENNGMKSYFFLTKTINDGHKLTKIQ